MRPWRGSFVLSAMELCFQDNGCDGPSAKEPLTTSRFAVGPTGPQNGNGCGGPAQQLPGHYDRNAWVGPMPDRAGADSVIARGVARLVPLCTVNERLTRVAARLHRNTPNDPISPRHAFGRVLRGIHAVERLLMA
jgi:hypothetical protein